MAQPAPQTEKFRQFIEMEVLKIIQQLALDSVTPKDKLQAIAQKTLDLIKPEMTLDELYQNAVKLDDHHTELAPVVFKLMKEYEDKYHQKAVEYVSHLIKNKEYEKAEDVVKKVLLFKIGSMT
jgi:hypothetical protein